MADWIAKYWLQALFGVVCSSMGAMFAWAKGKFKKQKAIEEGLRAVLHDRIYQAHAFYINQKWISSSDLKNIEYLYNAYHTLSREKNREERMIKQKLASLINVKTIVTFVVIGVFAYLAVKQAISPGESLVVVTTVIGFYFGTQKQKIEDKE